MFSWVITESSKFGSILGWLIGSPAVLSERRKYSSRKVASQCHCDW